MIAVAVGDLGMFVANCIGFAARPPVTLIPPVTASMGLFQPRVFYTVYYIVFDFNVRVLGVCLLAFTFSH